MLQWFTGDLRYGLRALRRNPMFSAVAVSRSIVNLVFGARKKLEGLPIGNVDWHKRTAKPA